MNKAITITIIAVLILGVGFFMLKNNSSVSGKTVAETNSNIQEINMQVDYSGYSPNYFTLKKGVPVKWNIDAKELSSCNQEIISKDFNLDIKLTKGLNSVQFTPDKTGTFYFTCGMGMLKGSFIVTDSGQATAEQIKTSTPSTSTCSMNRGSCGCGSKS